MNCAIQRRKPFSNFRFPSWNFSTWYNMALNLCKFTWIIQHKNCHFLGITQILYHIHFPPCSRVVLKKQIAAKKSVIVVSKIFLMKKGNGDVGGYISQQQIGVYIKDIDTSNNVCCWQSLQNLVVQKGGGGLVWFFVVLPPLEERWFSGLLGIVS